MNSNFKFKIKNYLNLPPDQFFFYLIILFFPTQLGLHFWPSWSFVNGIAVDYLSPTVYLTDILIFFTLFTWSLSSIFKLQNPASNLKLLSSRKNHLLPPSFPVISVVLAILFLFCVPLYLNPLVHIFKLLKLFELSLFGYYVSQNFSSFDKKLLVFFLAAGVFFESLLSVVQLVFQHSLGGLFYYFGERTFTANTPGIARAILDGKLFLRPYGTFSHPNSLAGYFLVSLFLLNYFLKFNNKYFYSKYLLSLISYLLLLIIFFSFSRTVWFAGFFIFLLIGLLNIKQLWRRIIFSKKSVLIFTLGFALCALTFTLLYRPIVSRFQSLATTDSTTVEKRLNLNLLAWKMFQSSPLVGVGLNNFIPNIPRFTKTEPAIRFYQPVHNIYLLVLSETGLFGFSIFLWLIYKIFKILLSSSLKLQDQASNFYLLISIIAILFTGLFDHYWLTLQQNQLLFVLLMGLIFRKNLSMF